MDVPRHAKGSPDGGQFAPRPAPDWGEAQPDGAGLHTPPTAAPDDGWAAEMAADATARTVRLYDEARTGAAAAIFARSGPGGPVSFTPI